MLYKYLTLKSGVIFPGSAGKMAGIFAEGWQYC